MLYKVKSISSLSFWNYMQAIYRCRLLIGMFTKRDIKAHYAQTRLGIAWSFIQALTAMGIIHLFFGILYKIEIDSKPFILFAFPGMAAWYYFAYIINNAGSSLIQSQHIIKKVSFPKMILPIYKTITGLTELLIWCFCYILLLLFMQIPVSLNIIFLPLVILLNVVTGFSIALWIASLTIRIRDALHIIPFIVGFGVFATPVFFSETILSQKYQLILYLNPMAGVVSLYRWCFTGNTIHSYYFIGFIPLLILLISGIIFFKRNEGKLADYI